MPLTVEAAMSARGRTIRIALCSLGIAITMPADAAMQAGEAMAAQEARIAACIHSAADGRLWLERTLWGLRDQEAGWVGAEIANSDGSHDLGPLQINSWWIERISERTGKSADRIRSWLTYDPCFNIAVARWIFLSALAATGNYWKAVGVYHSPTGHRQRRYAALVAAKLIRRFGAEIFANARRSVRH
jgi:hypothetical protein